MSGPAPSHPLPPDVVRRRGGGLEVRTRRGWRGLAIALGIGGVVLGLALLVVSFVLARVGADAGPLPWVGLAFTVGTPLVVAGELRRQRAEVWVIDGEGIRSGGPQSGAVRWAEVAVLRLHDRHTRLSAGRPWVRLVTVTIHGSDGTVLLTLPDENHDGRVRSVFAVAAAEGWIPAHVRSEERGDGPTAV